MRVRYLSITYQFGGSAPSLERHYRELREAMLHPGQHYAYMQPSAPWRPPMDIHETPDAFLVKVEVAGMRDESVEVVLYDNALVVTGQREDDSDHDETLCYHEAQVRYGLFRADAMLPVDVRKEDVAVTYKDGFLRVRLPKVAPTTTPVQGMGQRTQPQDEGTPHSTADAAPTDALPASTAVPTHFVVVS